MVRTVFGYCIFFIILQSTFIQKFFILILGKLLTDLIRKQNILFQYIKEIHGNLTEMQLTLKKIETNNKPTEINETCKISFIEDFNFPLSKEEDLRGFEEYLLNEINYAIVVSTYIHPYSIFCFFFYFHYKNIL